MKSMDQTWWEAVELHQTAHPQLMNHKELLFNFMTISPLILCKQKLEKKEEEKLVYDYEGILELYFLKTYHIIFLVSVITNKIII